MIFINGYIYLDIEPSKRFHIFGKHPEKDRFNKVQLIYFIYSIITITQFLFHFLLKFTLQQQP